LCEFETQKNDCSIRLPALILYPAFSRLTSKDSMRALRVAKGLQRTRPSDLAGVQLARHVSEIDRSCSPLVMSRCNRRVIDTREETRWETTRETYRHTCGSGEFYNFKALPFKPQIHFRRLRRRMMAFIYVRRK